MCSIDKEKVEKTAEEEKDSFSHQSRQSKTSE
jgi:hypothetical protein